MSNKEQGFQSIGHQLYMDARQVSGGLNFLQEILNEKANRGDELDETQLRGLAALVEGLQISLYGATEEWGEEEHFLVSKKPVQAA